MKMLKHIKLFENFNNELSNKLEKFIHQLQVIYVYYQLDNNDKRIKLPTKTSKSPAGDTYLEFEYFEYNPKNKVYESETPAISTAVTPPAGGRGPGFGRGPNVPGRSSGNYQVAYENPPKNQKYHEPHHVKDIHGEWLSGRYEYIEDFIKTLIEFSECVKLNSSLMSKEELKKYISDYDKNSSKLITKQVKAEIKNISKSLVDIMEGELQKQIPNDKKTNIRMKKILDDIKYHAREDSHI